MIEAAVIRERILSRVEHVPIAGFDEPCWIWTSHLNSQKYARISIGGRWYLAHRVAYEMFVGAIPDGRVLDHLCRVSRCVNPLHLEPVTYQENSRRGLRGDLTTHCPAGHPYDVHGRRRPRGSRDCLLCHRLREERKRRSAGVAPARRLDPDEVLSLYRQGLSTHEIGRRLGFDNSNISRLLHRLGEPIRRAS